MLLLDAEAIDSRELPAFAVMFNLLLGYDQRKRAELKQLNPGRTGNCNLATPKKHSPKAKNIFLQGCSIFSLKAYKMLPELGVLPLLFHHLPLNCNMVVGGAGGVVSINCISTLMKEAKKVIKSAFCSPACKLCDPSKGNGENQREWPPPGEEQQI